MLKEVVVLCPNGRRQTVKCLPNTSLVQVLEEVCRKQGFPFDKFELRHHNKVIDMTCLAKFSTLPNKAILEMVEIEGNRIESDVRVGLQTIAGDRKMGTFKPNTNLFDIVNALAPEHVNDPKIGVLYMGTAVYSMNLQSTTLRQIGLTAGNAILRLVSYSPEELKDQPNVSAVTAYPMKPDPNQRIQDDMAIKKPKTEDLREHIEEFRSIEPSKPTTSGVQPDILKEIRKISNKCQKTHDNAMDVDEAIGSDESMYSEHIPVENNLSNTIDTSEETSVSSKNSKINLQLEAQIRKGLVENNINFLGERFPVAYYLHSTIHNNEPDDFFELSVEEVRRLYSQLKAQAKALQQVPFQFKLSTCTITEVKQYNYAVIRVQFPDETAIQGIFHPTDTIKSIYDFTKSFVKDSHTEFELVTYPRTSQLEMSTTLQEAKYVPCVRLLYLSNKKNTDEESYLMADHLKKMVSNETADMIASKFRLASIS